MSTLLSEAVNAVEMQKAKLVAEGYLPQEAYKTVAELECYARLKSEELLNSVRSWLVCSFSKNHMLGEQDFISRIEAFLDKQGS